MFVPNPVTITSAGSSDTSTMSVFAGVPAGTSFTVTITGTSGTLSHSVSISVAVGPAPSFAKLHWTHHFSLSKNGNAQSWTAIATNPLSTNVNVVVRIVGSSIINPSLTFDVTCGVTCDDTAGGVNSTPGLTPVSVPAGASAVLFSLRQYINSNLDQQKVDFPGTPHPVTGPLCNPHRSEAR